MNPILHSGPRRASARQIVFPTLLKGLVMSLPIGVIVLDGRADMSFDGIQASETTTHVINATDWADYLGGSATFNSANDWGRLYWRGSAGDGQYIHFDLSSLAGKTSVAPAFVTLQNGYANWGGGVDGSFVATANGAWTAGGGQTVPGATAIGSAVNASGSYGTGASVSWGIGSSPIQSLIDNPAINFGLAVIGGSGSQLHFSGPMSPYLTVKTGRLSASTVTGVVSVVGGGGWNGASYSFDAGDSYSAAASLRIVGAVAGGSSGAGDVTINGANVLVHQPGGSDNFYWAVDSTTINAGGTLTINGHSHLHNLTLAGGELGGTGVSGAWGGWTLDDAIHVTGGTNSTISARLVHLDNGNITVDAGSTLYFPGTILSGSITKTGEGAMAISGNNAASGGVNVNGGTLVATRSETDHGAHTLGTGNVTVNNGGTLRSTANWATGSEWYPRTIGALTVNQGGTWSIEAVGQTIKNGLYLNGGTITGLYEHDDWGAIHLKSDITAGGGTNSLIAADMAVNWGRTITVDTGSLLTISRRIHNQITTVGALTKNGGGTLLLSGTNTYTGATTVNGGTLLVDGALGGSAVTVAGGALGGAGFLGGAVTANATATIVPGTDGTAGILTVDNSVTMDGGATFGLDVSTNSVSGNDQVALSGTLTLNTTVFNLKALGGSANLDTSADYVLAIAGTINGAPNPVIAWVGTPPANASGFSVVKTANTLLLHYVSATPPTITSVTASPTSVMRGQNTLITAAVTAGSNPLAGVQVSGTALVTSPVTLYADGAGNYTNVVAFAAGASLGSHTLTVVAVDDQSLGASSNVAVTVVAAHEVWNGGGSDNKWSTGANWVSGIQPGTGDHVAFDGSTQTTADMDASYNIPSLTFNSGAASFTITNAAHTLTVTGAITNQSPNAQTIDVPVALNTPQPIDAAAGSLTFGRSVSTTNGLTKAGAGSVTLAAVNTYTGGTIVNGGTLELAGAAGGIGLISGAVAVNTGATLMFTGGDGTGFGWNNTITSLAIDGGTVNAAGSSHLGFGSHASVSLNNGGTIAGQWQWNGDNLLGFSSTGDSQNTISGILNLRSDNGAYHTFNVADGTAPVDLLVDATLSDQWPEVWWVPASVLSKVGGGTMKVTGANTFGGVTVVAGGVLEVGTLANYGEASSLGNRAASDEAGGDVGILFRGGTLRYAGATAQSTDRGIRLSTSGGATIDASGLSPTATVSFTAAASPNFFENPGDRTLTLTGSNTGSNLFAMVIAEAGGTTYLNKSGAGTWILTASNTFSGPTIVSNGTLVVEGALGTGGATVSTNALLTINGTSVGGAVAVAAGATLGGTGTIVGAVTSEGTIQPGGSAAAGTLAVGSYAQSPTGSLQIEIGGSSSADMLLSSGAVAMGTLDVLFINGYTGTVGDTFIVIVGSSVSDPAVTNLPALGGGRLWNVQNVGSALVLSITNSTPPASGYDAWAVAITNGLTGYADSAAGDGYANLLKYATGSNPTNSDELARMDATRTGGLLALKFNRNTNATDVTLIVEGSDSATNGATWQGIATNTAGVWSPSQSETGTGNPVSVTVSDNAPGTNRFMRLRVTRP